MKNIVLLHKIESVKIIEVWVDVNRILAVEKSTGNTFKVYFERVYWEIDINDYEPLMSIWASYYKFIDNKCFN